MKPNVAIKPRRQVGGMKPEDAQQSGCAGNGRFPTQQQAAERAQRMRQRHGNSQPCNARKSGKEDVRV